MSNSKKSQVDVSFVIDARFGETLKRLRIGAGVGLRKFADMIDEPPSNLCAMEHGRRVAPAEPERLQEIAEALGLVEGSGDWNEFFDAARRENVRLASPDRGERQRGR